MTKPTITDQELTDALEQGAAIAVVTVGEAQLERRGTRSQATCYATRLESLLAGPQSSLDRIQHFGAPALVAGHRYLVAACDNQRFHGALQLRWWHAVADAGDEAWINELRARLARLVSPSEGPVQK